ncbi:MAG TPA: protein-glutamate O-methyltransferase CheR [Rhizomicrobium sp.]
MSASAFAFLADLLKRRSGLMLPTGKSHLIESRLAPVARRFGFKNVEALLHGLPHGTEAMSRAVTEAMTINDTWFFRDRAPFEAFKDVILPAMRIRRMTHGRIRIWCAASSTGQEAYSLAMLLHEAELAANDWEIELIATDLNADSIARAKEGLYTNFEVQRGLGIRRLVGHFMQVGEDQWRISDPLRRMVTFRTFNLLDSFDWLGEVDVVFCRNVLLYFDDATKKRVLRKLISVTAHDGFLVTGTAETPHELMPELEPVADARGLYVRAHRESKKARA